MHVQAPAASVAHKVECAAQKALGKVKKPMVHKAARVINKAVSLAKAVSCSLSPNLQQPDDATDFIMVNTSGPTIVDDAGQIDVNELEPDIRMDVIDDIRNSVWSDHCHHATVEEVPDEDERSLQCPPNSCRNPVIPVESSGFWRNEIWQEGLLFSSFQQNLGIPELRLECSTECTGMEYNRIRLFICSESVC